MPRAETRQKQYPLYTQVTYVITDRTTEAGALQYPDEIHDKIALLIYLEVLQRIETGETAVIEQNDDKMRNDITRHNSMASFL